MKVLKEILSYLLIFVISYIFFILVVSIFKLLINNILGVMLKFQNILFEFAFDLIGIYIIIFFTLTIINIIYNKYIINQLNKSLLELRLGDKKYENVQK